MITLIIGYPGSGKSELAEKLVTEISAPCDRIYLAAMIPYGDEGLKRVEKHRKMRAGKGFVTIEAPFDAADAVEAFDNAEEKTVLLECLSNLAANEMFERHTDPGKTADKLHADVCRLKDICANLVIVSNHFDNHGEFDEETAVYARTMDMINEKIGKLADRVIRI